MNGRGVKIPQEDRHGRLGTPQRNLQADFDAFPGLRWHRSVRCANGITCDTIAAMTRVVLDTDVVVAALRSPQGASAELLRRVHAGQLDMLANVALFAEYEAVLTRPEQLRATQHSAAAMRRLLDELAERVVRVTGWFQWRPQLHDPADEMVLEAAVNGHADALISFNRRDFGDAPARFGVLLATPGHFLRSLEP